MAETKILTDVEMTRFIWNHTKGDGHHKQQVKDSWLEFTLEAYAETECGPPRLFIERVNKWLMQHKIPAKVHTFNLLDETIGGTDWEIEQLVIPT